MGFFSRLVGKVSSVAKAIVRTVSAALPDPMPPPPPPPPPPPAPPPPPPRVKLPKIPQAGALTPEQVQRARGGNIVRELERQGLPPDVLAELARVVAAGGDWRARFTIEDYETAADDGEAPEGYGSGSRRVVTFIGDADYIATRALYLAEAGTIVELEADELAHGVDGGRPQWETDRVVLADGRTIVGDGRKPSSFVRRGPARASSGRMSAEDFARAKRAEKARRTRAAKTRDRVSELLATDPDAARALLRRSRAAAKKTTKLSGRPRSAKPKPKPKR